MCLPHTGSVSTREAEPAVQGRDGKHADRAPWLLRAVAVTIFVFPANMIFAPLGAIGFVSMILALILFLWWMTATIWGAHNPIPYRHPARLGLGILWIVTIISYIAMSGGPATAPGKASANRWILTLMALTGIMMVTAEWVRSREAVRSLVRALVGGATFCALVAVYQFMTHSNPTTWWTRLMVGMVDNGGVTTFQLRSSFIRVAGVTFTPIELGVVMLMILPLAIWKGMYGEGANRWTSWLQCGLIATAAIFTVSRSTILGIAIVCVVMIPFLPRVARRSAMIVLPVAVIGVFAFVPGMIATIVGIFTAGSADPNITTRLDNYPRVEAMVSARPWTGTGPHTYMPTNALKIFDNQYLMAAVELGLPGVLAFIAFLGLPAVAALMAARSLRDPAMKALAGGISASAFVALVSSATFDSFSFPVFTVVFPFIAGMSGVVWMAARGKQSVMAESSMDTRLEVVELQSPDKFGKN